MAKAPRTLKQTKQPEPATGKKPAADAKNDRRVKIREYRSFRLEKKVKRQNATSKIPTGFALLRGTYQIIRQHWKLFLGICGVNALLTAAFITGFSAVNLNDAKQSFGELVNGQLNQAATGLSLFVYLLGAAGNSGGASSASVYQVVIGVVVSLAVIWTLRQVYAGEKVRVRDGFYQGMYPLVQFILVLAVIGLQLLPLVAGAAIYQLVINNGIAVTVIEHILWLVLFILLGVLSLYMICSSFFALYIVSLPNVTPMAALRTARQLVLHRRWMVIRRVLFLPLALIVLSAIVLVPVIVFATSVAPWLFFILSTTLLVIVHTYLYSLYKAML